MPIPFPFTTLEWSHSQQQPRYLQLYEHIRRAILRGRLKSGEQLPPSRTLAQQLKVSRTTVMLAYDHLSAEGYLSGRAGAGTFVSEQVPDQLSRPPASTNAPLMANEQVSLSKRGKAILRLPSGRRLSGNNLKPFRPGVPALWDFPYTQWFRLMSRQGKSLGFDDFGYGDAAGFLPLRQAIARYLRQSRGVSCEAEQVIIVNGTQQAIGLACQLLLNPGDRAWIEDPGYNGAREAMCLMGVLPAPVPLDEEGISVAAGMEQSPGARLAYVTPSHQYPTGVVMSLARRLELLEWAARQQSWILEDDYDSEYRYSGKPLAALQGIDRRQRVVYMGTFSKVLFPSMRLGYLVVPPALVDAFHQAKSFSDRGNSLLEQATLAAFLEEGQLERHLRRMRLLYRERQEALCYWSEKLLGPALRVPASDTGLHVLGWLPKGKDDGAVARALRNKGLVTSPLSGYTQQFTQPPALVLGYAPYREELIREAVEKMAEVLATVK